ncbi:hypothetical protein [Microseira wollei]|nr:hypothetical protein [Microseira wollei]
MVFPAWGKLIYLFPLTLTQLCQQLISHLAIVRTHTFLTVRLPRQD